MFRMKTNETESNNMCRNGFVFNLHGNIDENYRVRPNVPGSFWNSTQKYKTIAVSECGLDECSFHDVFFLSRLKKISSKIFS